MSTDVKTPAPYDPETRHPAKPKIDLSLAQVLGGALAAMTAAYLGSQLSVAGTVVGAALASVVAAVAGNLYTASLHSTQQKVRTVFTGRVAGSDVPAVVTETPAAAPAVPASGARRLSVRDVMLGALAAFALAAAVLTGVELATGSALSGGDGTTITQVTEPRQAAPQPTPSAEATPSASPSPTPTAGDSPTPTPSTEAATPTPAPLPDPTTSATAPSPSASSDTGSPAPEPSVSATTSTSPGSGAG